jgi:hypothetical protein
MHGESVWLVSEELLSGLVDNLERLLAEVNGDSDAISVAILGGGVA